MDDAGDVLEGVSSFFLLCLGDCGEGGRGTGEGVPDWELGLGWLGVCVCGGYAGWCWSSRTEWGGGRKTYAEDGQENVDQQVGAAPALEEDTQRREDDGEDNLADVAGGRVSWGATRGGVDGEGRSGLAFRLEAW